MYIVAMWLRAPRDGSQGVNVVIHKHPEGLPHGGDTQKVMQDPGRSDAAIRYEELPRGGNRVQASLDLVLEDRDYDRAAILRALNEFERTRLGVYVSGPVTIDMALGQGRLRGVFAPNLGPLDPRATREVFSLLVGTIDRALTRRHAQIAA